MIHREPGGIGGVISAHDSRRLDQRIIGYRDDTLTRLESELKDDTNHTVVVTIITDGYENASKEYSLPSVKALIRHLTEEGWSFAYMGTDHDVHGVSVSLSITNVIQFEKTAEKTAETFKRERHARERHARLMWEYENACPDASWEDKKAYQSRIAREYYEEKKSGRK